MRSSNNSDSFRIASFLVSTLLLLLAGCGGKVDKSTTTHPLVNSLGMEFVAVPGTGVLFCKWETRVRDFEAFVKATGYDATAGMRSQHSQRRDWGEYGNTWESPGFKQNPLHPVVGVSWNDAHAFCAWLSEKEGRQYRLPTDHEWSCAVGIGDREDPEASPAEKDTKIRDDFPWGTQWPPPKWAGNYGGNHQWTFESKEVPRNADVYDDFIYTSPVGAFKANGYGLFDMGGNAREWCEDWYDGKEKWRVLRGCSWFSYFESAYPSSRGGASPDSRDANNGFRCVLVISRG